MTRTTTSRVHARLDWSGVPLDLRDMEAGDIEAIVGYWASADDELLETMGVDRARLGSRAALSDRFSQMVRTGESGQVRLGFAIELGGTLIGYTNLDRSTPPDAVSHWHIIDPARRGRGISTALYPYRVRTYFECTDIETLTHQTRTRNAAMNRVLDHFVPIAETRFLDRPNGLAAPGEFNIRRVHRADLPGILAIAGIGRP